MKVSLICFTERGFGTEKRLAGLLKAVGHAARPFVLGKYAMQAAAADHEIAFCPVREGTLGDWAGEQFREADALIFVGACGIAVRAIAPYVRDKFTDPAVLVVDEAARFVIPLLSGHVGGANELAFAVSTGLSAQPVITTATDVNGRFAVDVFAKAHGLAIDDRQAAKEISADILAGEPVGFFCDFPIDGPLPEGLYPNRICRRNLWITAGRREKAGLSAETCPRAGKSESREVRQLTEACPAVEGSAVREVSQSMEARPDEESGESRKVGQATEAGSSAGRILRLIPKCVAVGIGCRRGTKKETIAEILRQAMDKNHVDMRSVCAFASIDLKAQEAGILGLSAELGIPFLTYTKDELLTVPGSYTESEFVRQTTGVGNVCERAAMAACLEVSQRSRLLFGKYAADGVTVAAAYFCPELFGGPGSEKPRAEKGAPSQEPAEP